MSEATQPRYRRWVTVLILLGGLLPLALAGLACAHLPVAAANLTAEVRVMSSLEQWLAVITAFGVKPTYMLLSLGLIVVLWRQSAADLAALRWGLGFFLAGEAFCAANYLFFGGTSDFVEYLHGFGMTVCFGFTTYAVLEGVDERLVKLSPPQARCAALSLCRACIKHADVPCGLRRLFEFLTPALAVVALMPLCAPLRPLAYTTTILGSTYGYAHTALDQAYEIRFCALAAAVLVLASWGVLLSGRRDAVALAKVLFAAGLGPLGFGTLRLLLVSAYGDNLVWFDVWEELTELLFVLGVAVTLWLFRRSLLGAQTQPPPAAAPA